MTRFPHFALPFRFQRLPNGSLAVAVTEQWNTVGDELDEIGDCVELTARTEQGQRATLLGFGRPPSMEFRLDRDLNRAGLQAAIDEAEPRLRNLVLSGALDERDPGAHRLLTFYGIEELGYEPAATWRQPEPPRGR
jgi:hypothetical protein